MSMITHETIQRMRNSAPEPMGFDGERWRWRLKPEPRWFPNDDFSKCYDAPLLTYEYLEMEKKKFICGKLVFVAWTFDGKTPLFYEPGEDQEDRPLAFAEEMEIRLSQFKQKLREIGK